MPTQLRTRVLVSTLASVILISLLILLVAVERVDLNQRQNTLVALKDAVRQARELSLYVQYNAHDTNAYALGHLEHDEEFVQHAAQFRAITEALSPTLNVQDVHVENRQMLVEIGRLRDAYDAASVTLFAAADANRVNPSPTNQAVVDAAWEKRTCSATNLTPPPKHWRNIWTKMSPMRKASW